MSKKREINERPVGAKKIANIYLEIHVEDDEAIARFVHDLQDLNEKSDYEIYIPTQEK